MKNAKGVRFGTVFFLLIVTAIITAIGTYFYVSHLVNSISKSQQMYMGLSNVEQIVVQNYVGTIDAITGYNEIQNGIFAGYIDGLGDHNSYFLDEKNNKASVVPPSTAVGSGIHSRYDRNGGIFVQMVSLDSPAAKAGVKQGDVLVAVDGVSVTERGFRNSVLMLFAEPGATRTLSVMRPGSSDILELMLVYENYTEKTVESAMLSNGYGWLAIREFSAITPQELTRESQALIDAGATALVIDLRGNAAGDFSSMLQVADLLMPAGTICKSLASNTSGNRLHTSDAACLSLPFVLLQDGTTSGAAEILCAAVVENGVARSVGTVTAGNGREQATFELSNGTAIVLSVYEYLTPLGNTIENTGVLPVREVGAGSAALYPNAEETEDPQLKAACELLSGES